MNKYNTFLTLFILTFIAMIMFFVFYMQAIFGFALHAEEFDRHPNPFLILSRIFTPAVIISMIATGICSLLYRVIGIVNVARSKTVSDGEKALWVIGFILMGFITGIVFLVMAKGRKFVE